MPTIHQIARHTRRQLFGVHGVFDDLRAQWDNAIAEFQANRVALDQSESDLYAVYDYVQNDPADLEEWHKQLNHVMASQATMDSMASAVSTVAQWWQDFKDTVGMSGAGGLAGGLGLLPAFPITLGALLAIIAGGGVVIAGVASYITYINTKRDRVQQLIDSGVDPVQAVKTATEEAQATSGFSFGSTIEKTVMWLAIGGIGMMILPRLIGGKS